MIVARSVLRRAGSAQLVCQSRRCFSAATTVTETQATKPTAVPSKSSTAPTAATDLRAKFISTANYEDLPNKHWVRLRNVPRTAFRNDLVAFCKNLNNTFDVQKDLKAVVPVLDGTLEAVGDWFLCLSNEELANLVVARNSHLIGSKIVTVTKADFEQLKDRTAFQFSLVPPSAFPRSVVIQNLAFQTDVYQVRRFFGQFRLGPRSVVPVPDIRGRGQTGRFVVQLNNEVEVWRAVLERNREMVGQRIANVSPLAP